MPPGEEGGGGGGGNRMWYMVGPAVVATKVVSRSEVWRTSNYPEGGITHGVGLWDLG